MSFKKAVRILNKKDFLEIKSFMKKFDIKNTSTAICYLLESSLNKKKFNSRAIFDKEFEKIKKNTEDINEIGNVFNKTIHKMHLNYKLGKKDENLVEDFKEELLEILKFEKESLNILKKIDQNIDYGEK